MRVTSTGADFSACAALRPPNPPPIIMTLDFPLISLSTHSFFVYVTNFYAEVEQPPISALPDSSPRPGTSRAPRNHQGSLPQCLLLSPTPAPHPLEYETPTPPSRR